MKLILSAIKSTLTNGWFYAFWGLVGLFVGSFVGYIFLSISIDEEEAGKKVIAEVIGRCPDNYMPWEITEYMMPILTKRDGDSTLVFEKQIRRGCRLFLTGSETPEKIRELASDDPVVDTIYHTTVIGSVNMSTHRLAFSDTTYWTKVREKCPADTTKNPN